MMKNFASLVWIDYYLYALLDPRRLIQQLEQGQPKPLPLSVIVIAAVSLVEILSLSLLGSQSSFFFYKITYGWILLFLLIVLKVFVISALLDVACQFVGCVGRASVLMNLVGFALLPRMFFLPLMLVFKVFGFAPIFFYFFFSIGLLLWTSLIIMQGISELHHIKFARAVMVFMMPVAAVGGILFFISLLFVITVMGFVSG